MKSPAVSRDPQILHLPSQIERRIRRDECGGCWIWTGGVNHKGYGIVRFRGRTWPVHRLVYTIARGQIPAGLYVCHACDNPPCCNPSHLWVGDGQANMRDCVSKGRHPLARQTHCKRGHPLTPENTYIRLNAANHRECRLCASIGNRARRKNRKRPPSVRTGDSAACSARHRAGGFPA